MQLQLLQQPQPPVRPTASLSPPVSRVAVQAGRTDYSIQTTPSQLCDRRAPKCVRPCEKGVQYAPRRQSRRRLVGAAGGQEAQVLAVAEHGHQDAIARAVRAAGLCSTASHRQPHTASDITARSRPARRTAGAEEGGRRTCALGLAKAAALGHARVPRARVRLVLARAGLDVPVCTRAPELEATGSAPGHPTNQQASAPAAYAFGRCPTHRSSLRMHRPVQCAPL